MKNVKGTARQEAVGVREFVAKYVSLKDAETYCDYAHKPFSYGKRDKLIDRLEDKELRRAVEEVDEQIGAMVEEPRPKSGLDDYQMLPINVLLLRLRVFSVLEPLELELVERVLVRREVAITKWAKGKGISYRKAGKMRERSYQKVRQYLKVK